MSARIAKSWGAITGLSVGVGFLMMQAFFLVSWVSKDFEVASPLINVFSLIFPLNFLCLAVVGLVVLPVALKIANRALQPRLAFIALAGVLPLMPLLAVLILLITVPWVAALGYRPFGLGHPLPYYTAVFAEGVILAFGCGAMGLFYLLVVGMERSRDGGGG